MPPNNTEPQSVTVKKSSALFIAGEPYDFKRALSGRGQAGIAGFFTSTKNKTILAKEDKPGTCLAEGCAVVYAPPGIVFSQPPIIQASVQLAKRGDDKESICISAQDAFSAGEGENISSFDVFLFGSKRNPKTAISPEQRYNTEISQKIAALTPEVKKQLAYAIYTSQLNGDESLHTGQFMIATKKNNAGQNEITKLQRIDMGALGRFAVARQEKSEFDPLNTSATYASSGQFGKNYVSFLVSNPEVKKYLLELWRNTDIPMVAQLVEARFKAQMAILEENLTLKRKALEGFYKELHKDSPGALLKFESLGALETAALNTLLKTTSNRCQVMQEIASKKSASPISPRSSNTSTNDGISRQSQSSAPTTLTPPISLVSTRNNEHTVPTPNDVEVATKIVQLNKALSAYVKETKGITVFFTTYQSEKSLEIFTKLSEIADKNNPTEKSIEMMRAILHQAKLDPERSRLARKLAEAGLIKPAYEKIEDKTRRLR